jgi:hypothetical protein
MKFRIPVIAVFLLLSCSRHDPGQTVSMEDLLDEMTDLQRLAELPSGQYRSIQFSSYDRRSTRPTDSCWFSNDDGFGGEPIPAFQKVLREPDSTGTGQYLICDVRQPGAIVRLWTAGLNGKIKLFLDNSESPLYDGDAQDFFWKTADVLSGTDPKQEYSDLFRQFDATYFPIPFSSGCRIEWTGDIRKIHFYHVGLRVYARGTKVLTYNPEDFNNYFLKFSKLRSIYTDPDSADLSGLTESGIPLTSIPDSIGRELYFASGPGEIVNFSMRIDAQDPEKALRQSVLSIWFDDSSVPQVQSPAGDFFGAAPGLNPYQSLPFTVRADGMMTCRFPMPYRRNVRIILNNYSGRTIKVTGSVKTTAYTWDEERSMHFRARWKMDHGIIASTFESGRNSIQDIVYLMASGRGRVVGAAAMIYNPSNAVTSWGNWWGEGDEKIFADSDTVPSFFGTGSEDYFNYSWSSPRIFSFPYCGQPRNDGPGNRGYVSDFRWHILDDIFFTNKIAFYMELGHHGVVPGFSYGRIVYFYARPDVLDDYMKVRVPTIRYLPYFKWNPVAYLGSAGYKFYQAEKLLPAGRSLKAEKGKLWADSSIVVWKPVKKGDKIKFRLSSDVGSQNAILGLTLAHSPDGGNILISVNGKYVRFDGNEFISLYEPVQTTLGNHFSEPLVLLKGANEIILESLDGEKSKKVGIDFIWLKE